MLDVDTGRRQILHSSAQPFEAPNWTPDGARADLQLERPRGSWRGRLHRFDLATRTPTVIDTGFAVRNNNDHVLSFDGKMLGISDQSTDEGRSTIFTLPAAGGTPKRITPLGPSYFHGWSPDGKFWCTRAAADGELDIYKISTDGRPGDQADRGEGPRRRAGVHAGRQARSTSTRRAAA